VAYGAAGVYVLDKETLSVVTKYTNVGGKSANFVLVKDGKIYVAYGENGWEVLELVTI
jgi:septum formation topological specificity factor MinE